VKRRIAISIGLPAVLVAAALAVTANGQQSGPRTITLRATSQLDHVQGVDNPPSGHSAGDALVFTEKLLNSSHQTIGSDAANCTFLFGQQSLCTGVYSLSGGQVMVQLKQPGLTGTRTYTQAITGGTGRYARASGTVTVNQQSSGDHFTFHIHLPG
jgi:hypothetical protein